MNTAAPSPGAWCGSSPACPSPLNVGTRTNTVTPASSTPDRTGLPEAPQGLAVEAGLQLNLTVVAMENDIDAQMRAARFVDAEPVTPRTVIAHDANGGPSASPVTNGGSGDGFRTAGRATATVTTANLQTASIQAALADKMGDAPLCDTCGHITVRNGSCYRCFNCGDSKGCS